MKKILEKLIKMKNKTNFLKKILENLIKMIEKF